MCACGRGEGGGGCGARCSKSKGVGCTHVIPFQLLQLTCHHLSNDHNLYFVLLRFRSSTYQQLDTRWIAHAPSPESCPHTKELTRIADKVRVQDIPCALSPPPSISITFHNNKSLLLLLLVKVIYQRYRRVFALTGHIRRKTHLFHFYTNRLTANTVCPRLVVVATWVFAAFCHFLFRFFRRTLATVLFYYWARRM